MPASTRNSTNVGSIARRLAAEADLAAVRVRRVDDASGSFASPPRCCSSNSSRSRAESRSTPRTSCVRSLLPIEKPSKRCGELLGEHDVRGNLAHHVDLEPFSPRSRPLRGHPASTRSASSGVRQNGIITMTFVKPDLLAHALAARGTRARSLRGSRRCSSGSRRASRASDSPRAARTPRRRSGARTRWS